MTGGPVFQVLTSEEKATMTVAEPAGPGDRLSLTMLTQCQQCYSETVSTGRSDMFWSSAGPVQMYKRRRRKRKSRRNRNRRKKRRKKSKIRRGRRGREVDRCLCSVC